MALNIFILLFTDFLYRFAFLGRQKLVFSDFIFLQTTTFEKFSQSAFAFDSPKRKRAPKWVFILFFVSVFAKFSQVKTTNLTSCRRSKNKFHTGFAG